MSYGPFGTKPPMEPQAIEKKVSVNYFKKKVKIETAKYNLNTYFRFPQSYRTDLTASSMKSPTEPVKTQN